MIRVHKLYLILWGVVFSLLLYKSYNKNLEFVSKEQVIDYHLVTVTMPLVREFKNKNDLAFILAHEIAHLQLGHTTSNGHKIEDEYTADLLTVYYMRKAGYSVCGISKFWGNFGNRYLELDTTSHPNPQTRAYYMKFKGCESYKPYNIGVTVYDVEVVFGDLIKYTQGKIRHNTRIQVQILTIQVHAYAQTILRDK